MAKRRCLSVVAVPALASVILAGLPGGVGTAVAVSLAATAGGASRGGPAFGPLTPALTAQLSQHADEPVIVLLKSQAGQATASSGPAAAAARAAQASLDRELRAVHATGIKQFTLVNSLAATVSALEARRLAADPAVARVIPDARFTEPGPATAAVTARPGAARPVEGRARTASLPLHSIPGACSPVNESLLAPEGLARARRRTARPRRPRGRSGSPGPG